MTDVSTDTLHLPPRRSFFGRVAGAVALGFGGLLPAQVHAQSAPTRSDRPDWPGALKGSYRQVTDAYLLGLAHSHQGTLATLDRGVLSLGHPDAVEFIR